jgi:hypothetical protein
VPCVARCEDLPNVVDPTRAGILAATSGVVPASLLRPSKRDSENSVEAKFAEIFYYVSRETPLGAGPEWEVAPKQGIAFRRVLLG